VTRLTGFEEQFKEDPIKRRKHANSIDTIDEFHSDKTDSPPSSPPKDIELKSARSSMIYEEISDNSILSIRVKEEHSLPRFGAKADLNSRIIG
jgi:hypothetical protein